MRSIGRLHLIADAHAPRAMSLADIVERAVRGGADVVQYRNKTGAMREMIAEAESLLAVCRRLGVAMLVNDRVDLCMAIGADGVHLGLDDMPLGLARRLLGPAAIIGGTVRNAEQRAEAERYGADYVGLGPIYSTASKEVGHPVLGPDAIAEAVRRAAIPIIAIAGINAANVGEVIRAGAHGVAVIGAIVAATDPAAAAEQLVRAMDAAKQTRHI